jgi:antitoxin component YwqK of YwqJK toxin-antitoxin module
MQDKIPFDAEGNKHGLYEKYWDNGHLRYRGEYIHGIMHGPWIGYHSNGNLWYKENYDMGKEIGYYSYYNYNYNGTPYLKRFYAR